MFEYSIARTHSSKALDHDMGADLTIVTKLDIPLYYCERAYLDVHAQFRTGIN